MSDLISRQAVYEYLESKFNEYNISVFGNEFAGKILDGIDDIPTAYDVDGVIKGLEKYRNFITIQARGFVQTAINIVKDGGING